MLKRHSCFGNKKIPAHGLFVHNKNKKDETEVVERSVYQAHVKRWHTYVAKQYIPFIFLDVAFECGKTFFLESDGLKLCYAT